MSLQLSVTSQPQIGGGTALNVIGDAVNQAVYWELVSYDPETETEGPAMGSLLYEKTITDSAMHSKNYYLSPGDVSYTGKTDRVKARIAHA
jgi:hypothetical protein